MTESSATRVRRQLESNLAVLYKTAPHQEIIIAEYAGEELKITWDKPEGEPVNITRILVILKDYVAGTAKVVLTRPFEKHVAAAEMENLLLKDTGDMLQKLFRNAVHSGGVTGVATGSPGFTEVKLEIK